MHLHFEERAQWRSWLEAHHADVREIWMVFYKKHSGHPNIAYEDAVEEALCFGWIDSLIKRLDDDRYARKFTPRTGTEKWSALNLGRVRKLRAENRMTDAGRAVLPAEYPAEAAPRAVPREVPEALTAALAARPEAERFFSALAPSYRRAFVAWITNAKREETRKRRIGEAVEMLAAGRRLGMK